MFKSKSVRNGFCLTQNYMLAKGEGLCKQCLKTWLTFTGWSDEPCFIFVSYCLNVSIYSLSVKCFVDQLIILWLYADQFRWHKTWNCRCHQCFICALNWWHWLIYFCFMWACPKWLGSWTHGSVWTNWTYNTWYWAFLIFLVCSWRLLLIKTYIFFQTFLFQG